MSTMTDLGLRARDRHHRRAPRTRLDRFPRDPIARWSMRVALMLPVLTVVLLSATTPALEGTSNQSLTAALVDIDWTRGDGQWLALLYPHVSILLAAANPFGMLGLGIMGAVASGFLLQKVAEIIAQRAIPRSTGIILTLALAANPLYLYFASENMPGFLAFTFFGLAMADLVRFVNWGSTESGFRAGLLLMLAAFSDPTGVLFAVVAILASPFLRHGRPAAPGLRAANMLVIGFPTAGAFTTIVLLNLAFFASPWPGGTSSGVGAYPVSFSDLMTLYTTPTGWLLAAPVVSAWLVALVVRRPLTIPVSALVFALINAALLLGVIHPGAAGVTFLLLTLLAITIIPAAKSTLSNVLVDLIAVLQLGIAWAVAFDRPIVRDWMTSLVEGAQRIVG
ncbi:MAG: hypothetical protein RJQ01_08560 [Microcella sp.]|uniref:hypothetical protein n=1 Tax=Microcella sp. TaxID=1913979 RepID=UPI003315E6D7